VHSAITPATFGLSDRREVFAYLKLRGGRACIRDLMALHGGHIAFDPGWNLARLVEYLNGFVFFWPGATGGPIDHGIRHAERYLAVGEHLAFLRIPTESLPLGDALFSSVNSGSPRTANGRKSRRGSETFVPADRFVRSPSQVVEVVFQDSIELPDSTEWSDRLNDGWSTFL
jgi:hypothetical protein